MLQAVIIMAQITEEQKKEIREIILDRFYLGEMEDISDKSHLFRDLGFDDLDFIELVMELENHFDITIQDSEWENVEIVERVYDVVNNCL